MNRNLFFKSLIISITLLFTYTNASSQLVISQAMTPAQLVQNVLVGAGVTVSAVSFTGSATMIGSFTNGNTTNLGLTSGVLLTTGNATNVAAPVGSFMSDELALAGDADLEAVSPTIGSAGTNDASVLEFDFVPLSDTLSFRYVFASEEYPEYVCSNFNDVFGFFVTGPNPAGGSYTTKNIALIPSTTLPVAINSVNNGSPGTIANGGTCSNTNESTSYTNLYIDNEGLGGTTIVFDGFTTVLRAWCLVTPCQSYHIKLAVADVGDQKFDSGVFLDAYSFSTNGFDVTPTYSNSNLGNNAIEACSDGIFAFTTSTPQTTPLTINYTVSGTATNGVDYTAIPLSVTIPAGSDSVAVIIHPLSDALTEGTETVQLNVTNVCATQTYSLNIMDNLPFSVTACPDITICPTNSASLSASATGGVNLSPYQYNWNPGGGSGTPVSITPPIAPGNYTYVVTATDYCSQTATDNVVVTVSNNLSISAAPTNPFICSGGNVSLTASGSATSYTWSPATGLSSATGATVTASPSANQTYTVTGSNGGCTGSTQVTVNVGTSLVISVPSKSICSGANTTLIASGASNYTWSPGTGLSATTGTNVTANPPSTQTYTVIGSDASGCTGSTTVTITVGTNPVVTVTPNTPSICPGANVVLNASAIPSATNYIWSGGTGLSATTGTTVIANPSTTQTYTVIGSDAAGCSGSTTATVNVSSVPTISVTPNSPSICQGSSVVLNANGGSSYTWTGINLSATTGTSVTANPSSTQTYTVVGSNALGCTGTATATVNVAANPVVTVTPNSPAICPGSSVVLNASSNPAATSYTWSPGVGLSSTIGNSVSANPLSTQTYTVVGSTAAGCSGSTTATVNLSQPPSVTISNPINTTCSAANGSATASISGGSGAYSYLWSNGQATQTLTGVLAGTYSVVVTDSNTGCIGSASIIITDNPGPIASISSFNIASCGLSDGSATLNVNGGVTPYLFSWNSSPVQSSQNLQIVPTGAYIVTVTDANGCISTASVNIGVKSGPSVSATSQNEICERSDGSATAQGAGGLGAYTYLWSNGQSNATATNLAAGTYTVTISDGGCSAVTTVNVLETEGPTAGFSVHPQILTILDGPVSFTDNSSGNIVTWQWNLGDGSTSSGTEFSHPYAGLGTYLVTLLVTDANGCTDIVQDSVLVKEIFTLYIPNVFTPNGDGLNDLFTPYGLSVDPDNFSMQIFDRWGNMVFGTNKWLVNSAEGWNGTKNNKGTFEDATMDVYVYRIQLKELLGYKHEYIGRIALIP